MRAREFIKEGTMDDLYRDNEATMPATYAIPALKNQDPYLQYRFGVAIAGAKGAKQRAADGVEEFSSASEFGENEIVVSFDPDVSEYIDVALHAMGMSASDKKLVTTPQSEEPKWTNKVSPVIGFKGYNK